MLPLPVPPVPWGAGFVTLKVSAERGSEFPAPAQPGPAPTPECPRLAQGSIRRSLAQAGFKQSLQGHSSPQGPSLVAADTGSAVHQLQLLRAPSPPSRSCYTASPWGSYLCTCRTTCVQPAWAKLVLLAFVCLAFVCLAFIHFVHHQIIKTPRSSEMCARQMGGTVLS